VKRTQSSLPTADFRLIFESLPGQLAILSPDLTIVAVSDSYLRVSMTERDEIVGHNIFEVFPDNPDDRTATGVNNVRTSFLRVLRTRQPDTIALQKYDVRRPDSDGGGFEERYWNAVNSPVLDEQGEVKYIIHRAEDITEFVRLKKLESEERKLTLHLRSQAQNMEAEIFERAQELQDANRLLRLAQDQLEQRVAERTAQLEGMVAALHHSEDRYRMLFNSNPNPMWVYDVETLNFLAVNQAAIAQYGYSEDEFLSMTIKEIRPPEEIPTLLAAVTDLSPEATTTVYRRHKKKDGQLIEVEGTSREMTIDGKRTRVVLATDITERKNLENQLRQAQKMEAIGRLAGGIAHDCNNLLTAIIGYSDIILRDSNTSDCIRPQLEEIRAAGKRAAVLTSQLLAFSRKQLLQLRVLDLNEIVHDIEKMLRRVIGEDVDLVAISKPDLGMIKADPGQIEQILMNLAVNARDAMPQGGQLTIETCNIELEDAYARTHPEVIPGHYVLLAVSDTGHGMDLETQSHIFEPFFTTKGPGKGTGLGLSTVYGIVRQSGGHIWMYSEPDHGATFKIYFPRVDEVAEPSPVTADTSSSIHGTETILLVEDDRAVRELSRAALEMYGYKVLEAPGGSEALKLFGPSVSDIDIVVTDVIMPGMNGAALVERLHEQRPDLNVLFVSGYTEDATIRHGVLAEGVAFLQKPFTPQTLARRVREEIDKRPQ